MRKVIVLLVSMLCVSSAMYAAASEEGSGSGDGGRKKSRRHKKRTEVVVSSPLAALPDSIPLPKDLAQLLQLMVNLKDSGGFVITQYRNGAHNLQAYRNFVNAEGVVKPGDLANGAILGDLLTWVPTWQAGCECDWPTYQSAQGRNEFYDGPLLDKTGSAVKDVDGNDVVGLVRRTIKSHSRDGKEKKTYKLLLPRVAGVVQCIAIESAHEGGIKCLLPGQAQKQPQMPKTDSMVGTLRRRSSSILGSSSSSSSALK